MTDFTSTLAISLFFFHFGKSIVLVFCIKQESKGKNAFFCLLNEINTITIRKNHFCVLTCAYTLVRSLLASKHEGFGFETRIMLGVRMTLFLNDF